MEILASSHGVRVCFLPGCGRCSWGLLGSTCAGCMLSVPWGSWAPLRPHQCYPGDDRRTERFHLSAHQAEVITGESLGSLRSGGAPALGADRGVSEGASQPAILPVGVLLEPSITSPALPYSNNELNLIMRNDFALDLKSARKKSGLTQEDCAYLMDCHPTKLTRLENGKSLPELKDICMLSLIFGRTFESLFAYVLQTCRGELSSRLERLPDCPLRWAGRRNRQACLNRLAADLAEHQHREHGIA